eukprot:COSAG04_NODE_647_length_11596_cov_18.199878_12_plen_63_part_00
MRHICEQEWLKQPADHRRRTAAQVMSKVDEMIAQQDEEGTHAIMLAFKLADRSDFNPILIRF